MERNKIQLKYGQGTDMCNDLRKWFRNNYATFIILAHFSANARWLKNTRFASDLVWSGDCPWTGVEVMRRGGQAGYLFSSYITPLSTQKQRFSLKFVEVVSLDRTRNSRDNGDNSREVGPNQSAQFSEIHKNFFNVALESLPNRIWAIPQAERDIIHRRVG